MEQNKPSISVDDIDRAPTSLPSPPHQHIPQHDVDMLREAFNRLSTENFDLREQNLNLRRSNNTHEILDSLLKPYANRSFVFMCGYCSVVGLVLIGSGFKVAGFDLPSGVLEVLAGSTAVTVIGLVGMVLTGIFIGARKV